MNVLILGSGGREHALAWRMSQDRYSSSIYVWPGNPGMTGEKIFIVNKDFNEFNFRTFLKEKNIEFVMPGSEAFLYSGVSDWCKELSVTCFGPSKAASRLESSKLFSKKLMTEAGIATASYLDLSDCLDKDINLAFSALKDYQKPVIKISGPSLGKGVFVCDNADEAFEVLRNLKELPQAGMEDGIFVEEGLTGKEVSMFFACNGTEFIYLGSAQDHKRVFDGNKGPNTGGMGAVSPVSWVNESFIELVSEKFVQPTLNLMIKKETPFTGVLFLGLMVEGRDINLLEYNVRFGDPETQTILPLIEGDLTANLFHFTRGEKSLSPITLKDETAIHVVKAARGYPGTFGTSIEKGQQILISGDDFKSQLFFAGVKAGSSGLETSGGRVLGITSIGKDLNEARQKAYQDIKKAAFSGEHFRKDIGMNL